MIRRSSSGSTGCDERGVGDVVGDPLPDVVERRLLVGEAAGRDLRPGDHRARARVDDDHGGDEPLVAEDQPVAEALLAHVADAAAVDVGEAGRDPADHRGLAVTEVDHRAVAHHEDAVLRHADAHRDLGVRAQVPALAVHGHEVARAQRVEHPGQLAGRGVAADVDRRLLAGDDVDAGVGQPVDEPVDRALVAGDQRAREDDQVALAEREVLVLAAGHPAQRGGRLALRPGAEHEHPVVGQLVDLVHREHQPGWDVEVAEVVGDPGVADHRAPDDRHVPLPVAGRVEHLLDAVHVARGAHHEDPAGRLADHPVEDRPDVALGRDEARHVGVGRVAEQQVHAAVAEPVERRHVGQPAVQRRHVGLEVAGVEQRARPRVVTATASASGIEWFTAMNSHVNGPNCHGLAGRHLGLVRVEAALGELGVEQPEGEPRPHEWRAQAGLDEVGHATDVVLVPVGEDHRLDVVPAVLQVGEVGQHQVDAGLVLLGEQHPAVDDQQPAVELQHRHVAADLADAPERDDPEEARWERGRVFVELRHPPTLLSLAAGSVGPRACGPPECRRTHLPSLV